mmetsp:Transcript_68562/g.149817  ORF Transcript_68562/g.149817 Transcript_68562/m.149817 type:complete len:290 (-) Transcript_68562:1735-2604(-)
MKRRPVREAKARTSPSFSSTAAPGRTRLLFTKVPFRVDKSSNWWPTRWLNTTQWRPVTAESLTTKSQEAARPMVSSPAAGSAVCSPERQSFKNHCCCCAAAAAAVVVLLFFLFFFGALLLGTVGCASSSSSSSFSPPRARFVAPVGSRRRSFEARSAAPRSLLKAMSLPAKPFEVSSCRRLDASSEASEHHSRPPSPAGICAARSEAKAFTSQATLFGCQVQRRALKASASGPRSPLSAQSKEGPPAAQARQPAAKASDSWASSPNGAVRRASAMICRLRSCKAGQRRS